LGYAVYCPTNNHSYTSRLPNKLDICSAEIVAINEAANYALKKNTKKAIILTDSKSAIQKLDDNTINPKNDHITLKTKILLIEARDAGFEISFARIPSHSKINGNE